MTRFLETENHGIVGEFGFYALHIGEVNMGELPPMPLDQFCEFSADTIHLMAKNLDGLEYNTIATHVQELGQRLNHMDERTSPLRIDARPYAANPFRVLTEDNVVNIGGTYDVQYRAFTDFVLYVLGGGHVGWGEKGIPKPATKSLKRILTAFEQRQKEPGPTATS